MYNWVFHLSNGVTDTLESPVQYWFVCRHKVFIHRKVAGCHAWLNGRLKDGWVIVRDKTLVWKCEGQEVFGGK